MAKAPGGAPSGPRPSRISKEHPYIKPEGRAIAALGGRPFGAETPASPAVDTLKKVRKPTPVAAVSSQKRAPATRTPKAKATGPKGAAPFAFTAMPGHKTTVTIEPVGESTSSKNAVAPEKKAPPAAEKSVRAQVTAPKKKIIKSVGSSGYSPAEADALAEAVANVKTVQKNPVRAPSSPASSSPPTPPSSTPKVPHDAHIVAFNSKPKSPESLDAHIQAAIAAGKITSKVEEKKFEGLLKGDLVEIQLAADRFARADLKEAEFRTIGKRFKALFGVGRKERKTAEGERDANYTKWKTALNSHLARKMKDATEAALTKARWGSSVTGTQMNRKNPRKYAGMTPEQYRAAVLTRYRGLAVNKLGVSQLKLLEMRKVELRPPRERGLILKTAEWYGQQPKWKKLALSGAAAVGGSTALLVATGGLSGIVPITAYGGWRLARWGGGVAAGTVVGEGLEKLVRYTARLHHGLQKGETYESAALKQAKSQGADPSEVVEMLAKAKDEKSFEDFLALAAKVGGGFAAGMGANAALAEVLPTGVPTPPPKPMSPAHTTPSPAGPGAPPTPPPTSPSAPAAPPPASPPPPSSPSAPVPSGPASAPTQPPTHTPDSPDTHYQDEVRSKPSSPKGVGAKAGVSAPEPHTKPGAPMETRAPAATPMPERAPLMGGYTLKEGDTLWHLTKNAFNNDPRFAGLSEAQKNIFLDSQMKQLQAYINTLTPDQVKSEFGFRSSDINRAGWAGDHINLEKLNDPAFVERAYREAGMSPGISSASAPEQLGKPGIAEGSQEPPKIPESKPAPRPVGPTSPVEARAAAVVPAVEELESAREEALAGAVPRMRAEELTPGEITREQAQTPFEDVESSREQALQEAGDRIKSEELTPGEIEREGQMTPTPASAPTPASGSPNITTPETIASTPDLTPQQFEAVVRNQFAETVKDYFGDAGFIGFGGSDGMDRFETVGWRSAQSFIDEAKGENLDAFARQINMEPEEVSEFVQFLERSISPGAYHIDIAGKTIEQVLMEVARAGANATYQPSL